MTVKKENGSKSTKNTLSALFEKHAGQGHGEKPAEDLVTPRIQIIQAQSPALKKSKPEYQPDARAGDFFFTGNSSALDGDEGFLFQPCWYDRNYVEWNTRESGGGLVTVHPSDSDIIYRAERDSQYRDILTHSDGRTTQLVNTGNHYGFLVVDGMSHRCVINLSGSQLKNSRAWNNMIHSQYEIGKSGKFSPPSYAYFYRITSKEESNDKGSWYGWNIAVDSLLKEKIDFEQGQEFAEFCSEGGMKMQLAKPPTEKAPLLTKESDKDWE